MADALEIGLSALRAHQRALEVAGHNIANASTPGYSRQKVTLTTPAPESTTPGMLGRGVTVDSVRRTVDDLLVERLRQAQSEAGRLTRTNSVLSSVESTFDEPGSSGFAAAVNGFFASFQDLSNNPESSPMRASIVSEMRALPTRLNSLAGQFDGLRADLGNGLDVQIAHVNSLTASVAELNQRIARETLVGNSPNDLLDRREGLLKELSSSLGLKVTVDPRDQTARVSLGGRLIVSSQSSTDLISSRDASGNLVVSFADGVRADVASGAIGATLELHNRILPGYRAQLDGIASAIVHSFNAAQATGTGADVSNNRFVSDFAIDAAKRGLNLDDPAQALSGSTGMPKSFLPSYTDAAGVSQPRNLELNVYDPTTAVASKYVIRYDPGTGATPASRSFDDLVSAINTGRGGGFSVYPPAAGIPGITASALSVDGGVKLQLQAATGLSIDFSRALDLRPATAAWTGGAVSVSGGNAALAGKRLEFSVQAGGTQLALNYRDSFGTLVPFPAAGSNTVAIPAGATVFNGLTITAPAGPFVDGERFTVDLDATGAISGAFNQAANWTAGDATATFGGRYTGGMAFDPAQPWTMRVVTPGVVGAAAGAAPPNNPPVVQFSYWTTVDGTAVNRTFSRTLDASTPAGSLIEIADGVTARFGAGRLTAGDQVGITVDGQPDQAGLLPALGIDGMFTGYDAATIGVNQALADNPDQLSIGWTRAAGDNANVRSMLAVRDQKALDGGQRTIEAGYQATVSDIGVQVEQTKRLSETQGVIGQTLENRRSDVSGVNIDEEVGALISEQQAYTAAARLITTARENIQTLMDLLH